MTPFVLKATKTLIEIALPFIPKKRYQAKLDAIVSVEERHRGFDLRGWEFHSIPTHRGGESHTFYYHRSALPKAPTLLLLHGLNLDGRSYLNLDGLADQYHLMAYNWPEASERYNGKLDDFIDVLDDFIEAAKIDSCVVAGISLGGMIAPLYASRHTERICAVILISTKVPNYTEADRFQTRLSYEAIQGREDYQIYWAIELFTLRFLSRLSPEDRARAASLLQPKRVEFYRQAITAMKDFDGAAFASQLRAPVLVLHGTKDRIMEPECIADIREIIPHARIEIIHGAGHMMAYLQPDAIEGIIRDFLDSVDIEPHECFDV